MKKEHWKKYFEKVEHLRQKADKSKRVHLGLIKKLKSRNSKTRSSAASYLGWLKPTPESIKALLKCLNDENDSVRIEAAGALMKLEPETPEAVLPLIEAMRSGDNDLRNNAILALGALKTDAKEAIPDITQALKDKDSGIRISAALALGQITPKATAAIPFLLNALKDDEIMVRCYATSALGEIEPCAEGVIPAIIEMLDEDAADASTVLAHIGSLAVPYLVEELKKGNAERRSSAALALRDMGKEAREAISALTDALNDENKDVRDLSEQALRHFDNYE